MFSACPVLLITVTVTSYIPSDELKLLSSDSVHVAPFAIGDRRSISDSPDESPSRTLGCGFFIEFGPVWGDWSFDRPMWAEAAGKFRGDFFLHFRAPGRPRHKFLGVKICVGAGRHKFW